MKLFCRMATVLIVTLSASMTLLAQKKDSTYIGTAKGIVQDSVYNFVLESSTIAVYNASDSSLVAYRLANNFGEFSFSELPVNVPLNLVITFVGYKIYRQRFKIPNESKLVDFKNINLDRTENNLAEVVISSVPPPITMKGDTIEFNADAFKLDKNAVAEDLLRTLPGITLWGDGTITFNGKQIRQVLVEGKPFFGGDLTIATQNIAKNAIDKIQVYQLPKNDNGTLDSLTDINIKLKKGKKFGYFGKVAAGYGTDRHYESDANINYFNGKTQLGIAGATNDINKTAKDAQTLIRNSTFKGVGTNLEYQPDFSLKGINRSKSAGLVLQHDFISTPDYNNTNVLTANAFATDINKTLNQQTQSSIRLTDDSLLVQQRDLNEMVDSKRQYFDVRYEKKKNRYNFYATTKGNFSTELKRNTENSSSRSLQGPQSVNQSIFNTHRSDRDINFQTGLNHQGSMSGVSNPLTDYSVDYSLKSSALDLDRSAFTKFASIVDTSQNSLFDRKYNTRHDDIRQHLDFSLDNLLAGLVQPQDFLAQLTLKFKNSFDINVHREHNNVQDRGVDSDYMNNPFLTNKLRTLVIDERPGIVLGRNFQKSLFGRYVKSLNFSLDAGMQIFNQRSQSNQSFQNFAQHYQQFVPKASVSYNNNQIGDFEDVFNLDFNTEFEYPTLQQLYPLVDSLNQYNIQVGNPYLHPASKKMLSFNFQHANTQIKNTLNYDFNASASFIKHSFADSVIINNSGKSIYYTVNAGTRKSIELTGSLNKAFKFTNHQIQVNISNDFNFSKNPNYVNSIFVSSNNTYNNSRLTLYYTHKNLLAVNLTQGYNYYSSVQNNSNNRFTSVAVPTGLTVGLNLTKKLFINSNITYNHFTSTGVDSYNYTIWNVTSTYRFLPANNLELKIAVLDLLRQNTSIINYGNNNTIVNGRTDVLKQYGMVTLAYFPRQFGKSKK